MVQHADIDHTGITGVGGAVDTEDAQQGADITLTAATYINITSVALAAGTWDIWGWLTAGNVSGPSEQYAQIWNGSAQLAQTVQVNGNNGGGDYITVAVFAAAVVLASPTTIYLRGHSTLAGTAYGSTSLGTGGGSKIHAMKIA